MIKEQIKFGVQYDGVGPLTKYEGNIYNFKYLEIFENSLRKN